MAHICYAQFQRFIDGMVVANTSQTLLPYNSNVANLPSSPRGSTSLPPNPANGSLI